ncbi:MAG: hypothetical protein P8Z00_18510 [Anaerolineales bacterium]|jgi:uncharacterized membrane protein YozB (DUF420 family)
MHHKNLFTLILAGLLAFVIVIFLPQLLGIPLKDAIGKFVVYSIYGLFVVIYLLRFALIFLGVFAIYRMLRERHNKQMAL